MLGWLKDMMFVSPLSNRPTRSRQAGFTLVEVLVAISIIGIMASLLLPAVAKSKTKTKRIQCLGNLTQIGKALYMYGNDHEGRLPWQILPSDQKVELGSGWDDFTMDPAAIFSLPPMKLELGTVKVLLSPLDPERAVYNESAEADWEKYSPINEKLIPPNAISYLLAEGGDLGRPGTVLATTRNLSKCDLAEARWLGSDEPVRYRDAMAGLMKGQGNVVLADGSAHFSADADLGSSGQFTVQHHRSSGGQSVGSASTVMLGCCGGFEEVPITKVFNTTNGNHHVFIIDKSGSMRNDNRLNLAKAAMVDALYKITPRKKFYIYFFDSGSTPMPGKSKRGFKWEVDSIISWVDDKDPGGSTNPLDALQDSFERIGPDTIWLLTDGRFNCRGGGNAVRDLIQNLNTNQMTRVNTVGFHRRPEGVDPILSEIAQDNNGTYYFSRSYKDGKPPQ